MKLNFSKHKKTAAQLLREFVFPFVCALAWTIYSTLQLRLSDRTWPQAITIFGGAFFFVSWSTSQIFRVKKQHKVEEDFQHLLAELRIAARDIVGNTTGGKSVCYLLSGIKEENQPPMSFLHCNGPYALHDVNVEICDLDEFNRGVAAGQSNTQQRPRFKFEIILPGVAYPVPYQFAVDPHNKNERSFNIFYFARNGHFSQLVRMKKINGQWLTATKVLNGSTEPAFEWIQEGFLTQSDQKVEW